MENLLNNIITAQKFDRKLFSIKMNEYVNVRRIDSIQTLTNNLLRNFIDQIYKKKGYLYCLFNEVYQFYGKNVFKLGCCTDIDKRMVSYITSYVSASVIKYVSKAFYHYEIAESILFEKLYQNRVADNREFFNCDMEIIESTIEGIILEIETGDILNLVLKYNIKPIKIISYERQMNNCLMDIETLNLAEKFSPRILFEFSPIHRDDKKRDFMLLNSPDIDKRQAKIIKNQETRTIHEKYAFLHYWLKKTWKINEIKKENLSELHKKTTVLMNSRLLFTKKDSYYDFSPKNNELILKNNKKKDKDLQIEIIKDSIKLLGYDISSLFEINSGKSSMFDGMLEKNVFILDKEQFENNIKIIIQKSKLFGLHDLSKFFTYDKENMEKIKKNKNVSIKQFIGFINTILEKFGLFIENKQISKRIKINNESKVTKITFYQLMMLDFVSMVS